MMNPDSVRTLEAFIHEVMEKEGGVGLAVSVFNAEGETLYERCFGWRDQAAGLPLTCDTLMGLASVSKSFTALAVMQLHERGIIDVDEPVKTYIPGFAHGDVKVRHLMSHIGGFYPMRRQNVDEVMKKLDFDPKKDPYRSAAISEEALKDLLENFAAQTSFTGVAGENFSYSNDSFALLSEIVRLYGGEETFSAYADKYIMDPLGMVSSGARLVWEGDNITKLYQMREDGLADDWTMLDDQSAHPGAGGVKSTLNDMKKYVAMYLNLGKSSSGDRILSSHGIREMTRPRVMSELNEYYGYGMRSKAVCGMTVWGHGGDQPGVATQFDFSFETGIGTVVLCNTSQVSVSAISDMAMRLASGYPAVPSEIGYEPIVWSDEMMDDFCGDYETQEGSHVTIEKNGTVFRVLINGAETVAFPINRYMVRVKRLVEDLIVRLYRDDNGKTYALGGGYRMIPKVND